MVESQAKTVMVTFLVTFLALAGGSQYLPGDLDNVYVCDVSMEIGEFVRFSSTDYTAYPLPSGNNTGRRRCTDGSSKGVWMHITDYADQQGVDLLQVLSEVNGGPSMVPLPANPETAIQYDCPVEGGCVLK